MLFIDIDKVSLRYDQRSINEGLCRRLRAIEPLQYEEISWLAVEVRQDKGDLKSLCTPICKEFCAYVHQ